MANSTKKQGSGPVVATTQGAQAQGAPSQGQGRGRKASPDGKRSQIPFSLTELDRTRLDKAIAAAQSQSKFGVVNTQNFVEMAVKNAVTELIGES